MKILFFGTADLSKVFLEDLYNKGYQIFCVTMPDKPANRGQKLMPPAVKVFAEEKKISYIQVSNFMSEDIEKINKFDPDVGLAVSYGKIIPENIYTIPKYNTFNIHFSLLPKYRGAAPVQYALLNGESETGVSSFYLEKTLDTGAILLQEKIPISIEDNSETLFRKLVPLGIEIMNKTLNKFKNGEIEGKGQVGEPSFAPILKKEDGLIDWSLSAKEIYNRIRALYNWPGTFSIVGKGNLQGKRIKIIEALILENSSINEDFGKVFSTEKNKGFIVLCGKGKILVLRVQPENKPKMKAWDFLQSGQLLEGDTFN